MPWDAARRTPPTRVTLSNIFTQNTTVCASWRKDGLNGYKINLGSCANAALSINSAQVMEGKYGVVDVHPDEGYELTSFQVTDSGGRQISVSKITVLSNVPPMRRIPSSCRAAI